MFSNGLFIVVKVIIDDGILYAILSIDVRILYAIV